MPGGGKEGKHVIEFNLMLADGSIVTCSRERNSDLFYGAIAGLGALGAFRIKYRLLDLKGPVGFKIAPARTRTASISTRRSSTRQSDVT
jgi:hypothetical protein